MPEVVVDANVVYAERMERDQWHEEGTEIVRAMDRGDLPRGQITNYALPEILNPIQKRAGDDRAVETLTLLTKSGGFRIRYIAQEDFDRGCALFRRTSEVELPDLITVAYMRRVGLEFIYSFDEDFDRFDDITRLTTPDNPFS